jgi:hypothetical protein
MKVPVKKTTTRTTNAISEESTLNLEEQIRRRAYELYEQRGWENGHDIEDWLAAEAELAREKIKPLEAEAVKKARKAPIKKTGNSKAKQAKSVESIKTV